MRPRQYVDSDQSIAVFDPFYHNLQHSFLDRFEILELNKKHKMLTKRNRHMHNCCKLQAISEVEVFHTHTNLYIPSSIEAVSS